MCNSSRKFWGPLPLKLHTIQSDSAPQFEKISLAQRAYRVAKLTRLRVSYRTAKRYIENSLASSYRPAKRFPSPKTPDVSFRQHDLCEQSTSRRSDRRAIALRASTAQSLRDCFAQDDTRGEMSVKIYHDPVGATCGRPLVGSAPFEGGRSQIAPTKSWDFR